jgi:uncharacterized protein (DUF433 family)
MTPTGYAHVEAREDGTAYVAGTQTKVLEVALDRLTHHWDADEIRRQHPHLGLSQVYSALAYYYDHQEEIDRAIAERIELASDIRTKLGASPLRARLQAQGLVS